MRRRRTGGNCLECKTELNGDNSYIGVSYCKNCSNERLRKQNSFNKWYVLKHYGGDPPRCQCCGESNMVFLTIDHIISLKESWSQTTNGSWSRKDTGNNLHRRLIKEGFPSGYQVLCFNCNQAKGINDFCPHKLTPNFSWEQHQESVGA
jgi:hypothetical protein